MLIVLGTGRRLSVPKQLEDRGRLHQRAERASMKRWHVRVADEVVGVAHPTDHVAVDELAH